MPASPIQLRPVELADLEVIFENQADPVAIEMGDLTTRERPAFDEHWAKLLVNPDAIVRTIVVDGQAVGAVQSWTQGESRLSGYAVSREFWGRGIATAALAEFLTIDTHRPLHADVAKHNAGSVRVLEKCGYRLAEKYENGYHYVLDVR